MARPADGGDDAAVMQTSGSSATVRSVDRCIDIIDLLAKERRALSLSAISRAISTPKSTTLSIVRTLVRRGLLAVDPQTRQYQLGLGFSRYVFQQPRRVDLVELSAPFLERLAQETLETSTLARREADKVFNVCRFVGPQPLQLLVPIGVARELHATAAGKLFLAWMDDAERRAYLASHRLQRFTPRTLTDPVAVARHVAACRRSGFAIARGETSAELFGVAAPIFGSAGRIVAAVNLSGPLFRLRNNKTSYVRAVCRTAADISSELQRVGAAVVIPGASRRQP
jgi:DNA-binding IclR family transcriptional regulator